MTLYLDTNVVISSGKRPEDERLRSMAIAGSVLLFRSPTVIHEHQARSIAANDIQLSYTLGAASDAVAARERLQAVEAAVHRWWAPAPFNYPYGTFEGLIASPYAFRGDPTGERALLAELLERYGVEGTDAIHLMMAYSAELDRFLTWDRDLIKKVQRISWLKLQVETPRDFLASSPCESTSRAF